MKKESAEILALRRVEARAVQASMLSRRRLDLAVTMLFFRDKVFLAFRESLDKAEEVTLTRYVARKYFRLTFKVEEGRWGSIIEIPEEERKEAERKRRKIQ